MYISDMKHIVNSNVFLTEHLPSNTIAAKIL